MDQNSKYMCLTCGQIIDFNAVRFIDSLTIMSVFIDDRMFIDDTLAIMWGFFWVTINSFLVCLI